MGGDNIEVKIIENCGEKIDMEEVNLDKDQDESNNEGVECVQQ